jgi:hypothetical protein
MRAWSWMYMQDFLKTSFTHEVCLHSEAAALCGYVGLLCELVSLFSISAISFPQCFLPKRGARFGSFCSFPLFAVRYQ